MDFKKYFHKYYQKLKSIMGLSLSLAKSRFKLRNEGSYLGIFWYLLYPLSMFLILLFLKEILHKTTTDHYPIYLFLGLIMFNFFRQTTNMSADTISRNSGFIKSLKIDQESFVIANAIQSTLSHIFEVIILSIFMIFFKISLVWLIFYPLIFLFFIVFTLGISFILAVAGAYANDFSNAWSVFLNALWFITPIYYVVSEQNISLLNQINPLYYFIEISREIVIFGQMPSVSLLLAIFSLTTVIFLIGILIFEKYKSKFAEMI